MGTLANSIDPDGLHCLLIKDKTNLQRMKYNMFWGIISSDPSLYAMDHPDFIVWSFMENLLAFRGLTDHCWGWSVSLDRAFTSHTLQERTWIKAEFKFRPLFPQNCCMYKKINLASVFFFLKIFANSLDPDQDLQMIRPREYRSWSGSELSDSMHRIILYSTQAPLDAFEI